MKCAIVHTPINFDETTNTDKGKKKNLRENENDKGCDGSGRLFLHFQPIIYAK